VLLPLGNFAEAVAAVERARVEDPLSPFPIQHLALAHAARGADEEAMALLRQLLELHETFWPGLYFMGGMYTAAGMTGDAISVLEKAFQIMPSFRGLLGSLAGNYARAGDRPRGERLLAQFGADGQGRIPPLGLAVFHALCSEWDRAAVRYEQAIEDRDLAAVELAVSPFLRGLRASPRGPDLLRKMHLAVVGA
jgi:tetratricopeptide (TPR) repeat protein